MLTVACVRVKANVPYPPEYVTRLRASVAHYLKRPHRFVCLTDDLDTTISGVDMIGIPAMPKGVPGWWAKIELFNPKYNLSGRVLYLDLDTLPVDKLDPIVDAGGAFTLAPDGGTFKGRGHLKVVKKYNSSVMVWDDRASVHNLYMRWRPEFVERLWGDQDFIAETMPDLDVFPTTWVPRLSEIVADMSRVKDPVNFTRDEFVSFARDARARVVLSKKPKNEEAAERWPWFRELWR